MIMDTAHFLKSHLTDCLHKKSVINPYTGDVILVPCGQCAACYYADSVKKELKCYSQEAISKYAYFVTLSYKNKFIPRYCMFPKPLSSDGDKLLVRYKSIPRHFAGLSQKDDFEGFFVCDRQYYIDYCAQADLSIDGKYPFDSNTYSYISHIDMQLFLKRLRRYLFKFTHSYESISLYFVGEYGPKRFRSHWHLLLFFDSDQIASHLGVALHNCWKFGNIDYSQSRKDATSYVAGYTNSFTALPAHLKSHRLLRPYSRFSNGFGKKLFISFQEDIRKGIFSSSSTGVKCQLNGRCVRVFPSRSVYTSCIFYPCNFRGATLSSISRLLQSYSSICRRPAYQGCSVYQLAVRFVKFLSLISVNLSLLRRYSYDDSIRYILFYIGISYDKISVFLEADRKRLVNSLYRLFSDCHHFLVGWNIPVIHLTRHLNSLYRAIRNSFDFFEYRNRSTQSDYYAKLSQFPDGLDYYYWRPLPDMYNQLLITKYASLLSDEQRKICYERIKHRELNDLNMKYVSML